MTIPAPELQPVTRAGSGCGVLAIAIVIVLALVVTAVLVPAFGMARASSRQIKDSQNVREIHAGLVLWGQSGPDSYLIPSDVDKSHAALAVGSPKDLPRHIVSTLIYNGFITPEICISPAEANRAIRVYKGFEYSSPKAAANPKMAMWDPAFAATPNDIGPDGRPVGRGSFSYAIMPFIGERRQKWRNTFQATEAILGNRGPAFDADGPGTQFKWTLHKDSGRSQGGNTEIGINSNTLRIHGGTETWEGNIVYNDNHVNYETRPDPETLPFTFAGLPAGARTKFDNLFVNENDQTRAKEGTTGLSGAPMNNTNNLLRCWTGGTFDPKTGALIDIPTQFWFD